MEVTREVPPTAENSSEDYVYNSDTNDTASAEEPRLLVPDGNIPSLLEEVSGRQVDRREDGTLKENGDGTQDVNDEVDEGLPRPNVSSYINNDSSADLNDKRCDEVHDEVDDGLSRPNVSSEVAKQPSKDMIANKRRQVDRRDDETLNANEDGTHDVNDEVDDGLTRPNVSSHIDNESSTNDKRYVQDLVALSKRTELELRDRIYQLQKKDSIHLERRTTLNMELNRYKSLVKEKTLEVNEVRSDCEKLKSMTKELKLQPQSKEDIYKDMIQKRDQISRISNENKHVISELEKAKQQIKDQDWELHNKDQHIQGLERQINDFANTVRELDDEESTVTLRLLVNRFVGAQLTIDNPNLTYLLDMIRPAKLAEQYSELHDNELTDAFEE